MAHTVQHEEQLMEAQTVVVYVNAEWLRSEVDESNEGVRGPPGKLGVKSLPVGDVLVLNADTLAVALKL